MKDQGKILGIDYGLSSIGLAISDDSQQFVFGRDTLKVDKNKGQQEIFQKIADLCNTEPVQKIIIGLPLNGEGNETPQTIRIRKFAEKLQGFVGEIPIAFEDESFSSFEADQILKEHKLKPAQKKELQHQFAAAIILKKFLKIS